VDQQWIAAFRMKNFNYDAAILRSGSGNQLLHLVYLAETAKDFFQPFAGLPRRRTTGATEFEYDPWFVFRLHLLLLYYATHAAASTSRCAASDKLPGTALASWANLTNRTTLARLTPYFFEHWVSDIPDRRS